MTTHTWRDATRTQAERAETASALARAEQAERERDEAYVARDAALAAADAALALDDAQAEREAHAQTRRERDAYRRRAMRATAADRADLIIAGHSVLCAEVGADAECKACPGRAAGDSAACGVVDDDTLGAVGASPRVCDLPAGHGGPHRDSRCPTSPCPGRAACDCPAGEHCPGTVAP